MQLLDGKSCSQQILHEIAKEVDAIKDAGVLVEYLVVVLVCDDGARGN